MDVDTTSKETNKDVEKQLHQESVMDVDTINKETATERSSYLMAMPHWLLKIIFLPMLK